MTPRLVSTLPLFCAALLATSAAPGQDLAARLARQPRGHVGALRDDDGSIRAEGPCWQARFRADHARFEVEAGDDRDVIAALELRYVGASRGGAWLPADATADRILAGREVRQTHGSVAETYLLRGEGIEQTFVFAEPPAGSGDLVLRIAAGGNVWARASTTARHQPIEFRFADRPAIRYGEAFAVDRHGARAAIASRYDGQGHIELIVPADVIAGASYPLTVDPVVGPVLLPGGTSWPDNEPDVAHDVEQNVFLVVWRRNFAGSNGIRGATYDDAGTVLDTFIAIADAVDAVAPAVAFTRSLNDNSFLVVWQQPSGIQGRLVTAATGATPAAAFPISSPGLGEADRRPTVSGPDGAMMVAWDRTASGATDPTQIVMRDLYWLNPADPTAITYGGEHVLQTVTTGNVSHVRLARSNVIVQVGVENWYANRAVWQQFFTSPAPGDHDIRTMSFRTKPSPLSYAIADPSSLVPGAADVGPDEILPDIGSQASIYHDPTDLHYLVAWQDEGDVLAHAFDLDGPTGFGITVRATAEFEGAPAVGAGACEYTVAYLQITPPAEFDVDVYAARVLPDGTVPEAHRLVDDPGSQYQDHVRASSRPILTSSQYGRNVSLLTWMGQTGPSGGLNDVRARFFEPVHFTSGFYGTACPGPLGELPAIGSAGGDPVPGNDLYAITVSGAPANSLAALLVGGGLVDVPVPGAPGCNLYANIPFIFLLPALTDGGGFGQVALPIPCSMPVDAPVAMQWGVYTPGWNAFGWITSNDLDVTWID